MKDMFIILGSHKILLSDCTSGSTIERRSMTWESILLNWIFIDHKEMKICPAILLIFLRLIDLIE